MRYSGARASEAGGQHLRGTLQHIIRDTFALPADLTLEDETALAAIPGWDSVGWVKVIHAVETEFAVELPLDELADVETLGDFLSIVERAADGDGPT